MNIRIAAIGSDSMIERVIKLANQFTGVEIIPYIYDTIEETIELVRNVADVDVLLFTGSLPYMFAKREIDEKEIPAVYIPLDDYIVVLTLFNVKLQLNYSKFSLDVSDFVNVYDIFDEIGLNSRDIFVKDISNIYDEEGKLNDEEIIQFHENLWNEGKIEIAVTCISTVYKTLQKKNIPVIRMIHPQKTIKDSLREAIMHGKLELSKRAQIIVGIVSIDNYQAHVTNKGSYFAESNSLLLHQILLDFSTEIHASLQQVGKNEFIIYGTKGSFEIITNYYRGLPVLFKIKKLLNMKVNIGFGFGLTTKEAESNAQIALQHSSQNSASTCAYIMNADKSLMGPLTQNRIEEIYGIEEKFDNDFLIGISNSTGINMKNVRKIVEYSKISGNQPFSATGLADYMQISRRGAERFLQILVSSNCAEIVGKEQVSQSGRPKTLYQLIEKF